MTQITHEMVEASALSICPDAWRTNADGRFELDEPARDEVRSVARDAIIAALAAVAVIAPIDEIAAERHRQVSAEGWTPEHDDSHDMGELANAAACYALTPIRRAWSVPYHGSLLIWLWPWSRGWWKPAKRPSKRRHELIKAGALIVAEIERLDRKTSAAPSDAVTGNPREGGAA